MRYYNPSDENNKTLSQQEHNKLSLDEKLKHRRVFRYRILPFLSFVIYIPTTTYAITDYIDVVILSRFKFFRKTISIRFDKLETMY